MFIFLFRRVSTKESPLKHEYPHSHPLIPLEFSPKLSVAPAYVKVKEWKGTLKFHGRTFPQTAREAIILPVLKEEISSS